MTAAKEQEPTRISAVPAVHSPGAGSAGRRPAPSRPVLVAWLLGVTRPVLKPLLGSTLCRITDLLLGVGLFALGAHAVVATGVNGVEGPAGEIGTTALLRLDPTRTANIEF